MNLNNINKISFLKIDTEGYEYEILKGLKKKIQFVDTIMFEHHYDNMIIKNYTFRDINNYLKINNFNQIYKKLQIKIFKLKDYIEKNNIEKIDFMKIDTEGYEFEILLGLESKIKLVDIIMFEHHYDNMIKKGYTFEDINKLLIKNNFNKIYKSRMPFRKTFEYIYKREELIN